MVDIHRLDREIKNRGLAQREVAKALDLSEKTFALKMKEGTFDTQEAQRLVRLLDLKEPGAIFFANKVT